MEPRARAILETAIYGSDVEALERFYADVFGLETILRVPGRLVALRCGFGALLVFDPAATEEGGDVPPHGARGAGHVAFVYLARELEAWRHRLSEAGVEIEREVVWPEGGRSVYVRDPAGNSVELAPSSIWSGLGERLLASLETGHGAEGEERGAR